MKNLQVISRAPGQILFLVSICLLSQSLATAQDVRLAPPDNAPVTPPDDAPSVLSDSPTPTVGRSVTVPSALQQAESQSSALLSPGGGIWLAEGPGPSIFGQVENIVVGPNEVSGAVHVIAAHPSDPNILYAGGANGGLWKTTNALDLRPFWTPLTDDKPSLSMGALEFDPADVTNQTLLAGVGLYSSFSQQGGLRTGLLRTTDGGSTWTDLSGGGSLTGANISGVAPRGTTIVASVNFADVFSCANIGIWRSIDTGASFGLLTAGTGVPPGVAYDLASDPLDPGRLYTGVVFGSVCSGGALSNGIYASADTGATWSKISDAAMDALIDDNLTNNIEIAAAGANVYVNIIQQGRPVGIFHSSDFGGSWTEMDMPRTPEGSLLAIGTVTPGTPVTIDTSPTPHGLAGNGEEVSILGVTGPAIDGVWTTTVVNSVTYTLNGSDDATAWTPATGTWQKVVGVSPKQKAGGQGGIHAAIVVDPTDPTRVAVGGDRQDSPFPNYLGAVDFTGRLFRGDSTVAATGAIPSPQWEHMTHSNAVAGVPGGGTPSSGAPHADSREMVWSGGDRIIEADDGGVYRRESASDNTGDWFSLNGNIQVTEQHDVAYDSLSNIIISGNQDTGTTYQQTQHGLTWVSVSTGDGGDVAVDDVSLPTVSTRYSSFQDFAAFRRQDFNASNGFISQSFPALTPLGVMVPAAQFVTPIELNTNTPTRLLIGACNAIFESMDRGDTIMEISGLTGCPGSAMTYGGFSGGVPDPETIWAAVGATVFLRTGAGGAFVQQSYPGTSDVTGIVVDPTDNRTAYVTDATTVWQTYDGGATWVDITGNLTDTQIRSTVIDPGPTARIFVGGRQGVFDMPLPTPGIAAVGPFVWTTTGSGLAKAPVWDMEWDVADAKLIVGTLGRGAWTLQEDGTCGFPKDLVVNNRIVRTTSQFQACNTISAGPALTVDSTSPDTVDFVAGISISFSNGTVFGGDGVVTVSIDPNLISP